MPLSQAGTSAIVRRLTNAGVISREPGPTDRRRAVLRAAPPVELQIATLLRPLLAEIEALTTALHVTERTSVERFLSRAAYLCERHAAALQGTADAERRTASGIQPPTLWG